jgi:hypothetical protein
MASMATFERDRVAPVVPPVVERRDAPRREGPVMGAGADRELTAVPVTEEQPPPTTAVDIKGRRGGIGQATTSFFGTLFSSRVGTALERLFGAGDVPDAEVRSYLDAITKSDDIEGNFDSDQKARAAVARWKSGAARFSLTPRQKLLLIREMMDGVTAGADERAILDLLAGSENGDLRHVFAVLPVDALRGEFSGDNLKRLDAWLTARFDGGAAALRQAKIEPKPGLPAAVPLAPYDWATFRVKFEGPYLVDEISAELARHSAAEKERAARDLATARTRLQADINAKSDAAAKEPDQAKKDAINAEIATMSRLRLRYEIVMEQVFADVIRTESVAAFESKTHDLTPAEKDAARKALAPGDPNPSFIDKLPGEAETYEQKLRALTPGMIDEYWNALAKDRTRAEHSDPKQMHTLGEMEDLAEVSKSETDDVFAGYYDRGAHPALKADTKTRRGNLHDLWQDTDNFLSDPRTSLQSKREKAQALVIYFFQSDRKHVAPLNRAHHASAKFDPDDKPLNPEAKAQHRIVVEMSGTASQVRRLNEIDRGWPASAKPRTGDVNVQLFKPKGGDAGDQDFLWDMFQTLIHEYLHTLVNGRYRTYADSFGRSSIEKNTLIEGMDSFLDEIVWANVRPRVGDQALRQKVEGPKYAALPPIQVRHASRRRYATYTEAVRLVNIVGFRNVVVAYFKGDVEKIGGP